jgi:hypothetical protein
VTTLQSSHSLSLTHTHTHTLVSTVSFSLTVAWYRHSTADVSLPLSSLNVPGLIYQLLTATAHNWTPVVLPLTEVEVKLRQTVTRPVCLGVRLPSGTYDHVFFFLLETGGFIAVGRPI